MMKNIFVYGSLMFEPVWQRVVSGDYQKTNGHLYGYSRYSIKDETYPGIIEDSGDVDGVIWLGVSNTDIDKLDRFEGKYYQRQQVFVADDHDRCLDCDTYVIAENYRDLLSDSPWDEELFQEQYLQQFIAQYTGFK